MTKRPELAPRDVQITIDLHDDEPTLTRPLAIAAAALLAILVAIFVLTGGATGQRTRPPSAGVLVPHNVKLRCEHSVTPRVFVQVPARYAAIAAQGPKCH